MQQLAGVRLLESHVDVHMALANSNSTAACSSGQGRF